MPSILGEHGLERYGQAYFHPRYSWYHRCHLGRFYRQGSYEDYSYFDFVVPTELPGVDPKILDPRDTYADAAEWTKKAEDLAARFIKNFAKSRVTKPVRLWLQQVRSCNFTVKHNIESSVWILQADFFCSAHECYKTKKL